MPKSLHPIFHFFASLFIICIFLLAASCSDKKARQMLELAEFEELQMNDTHAEEIYREIIKKFPDTEAAKTAAENLKKIENKKQLTREPEKRSLKGGATMSENNTAYSILDQPSILQFIFHPRPDYENGTPSGNVNNMQIPVEEQVTIGAKFHHADKTAPTILFFHGNGEIVSDYDDLGPLFTQMNINFFPVDYRGYGTSTGSPTVSAMISDAHKIYDFAKEYLRSNGYSASMIIMGRSLGSASALELSSAHSSEIKALIIESGFAYAIPLLKLLGVNTGQLNISEEEAFDNFNKIKHSDLPTLIIHAEYDHIIPFSDGKTLFDASPASRKNFLKIPGANHNNIFAMGLEPYMIEIKKLADSI